MATEVGSLTLKVETGDVKRAKSDVEKLTQSAGALQEAIEDIEEAQKSIWCLCDVSERVSLLRKRGYNLLKPTVTVGARCIQRMHGTCLDCF